MTTIEWTRNPDGSKGKTWNPIRAWRTVNGKRIRGWHCEHVHEGCKHCYAEDQNKTGARGGTKLAYVPGNRAKVEIELDEKTLRQPLHWKKPTTIFVCSMTDLFGAWVRQAWLDKIFAVAMLCPQHTFIVLTKRPERSREYFVTMERCVNSAMDTFADRWGLAAAQVTDSPCAAGAIEDVAFPVPNVWLLTSCSEQKDADKFIPELLATPAAVRGVSLEPLLGPMDISDYLVETARTNREAYLDCAFVGGESGGKKARPMHPQWPRNLRDQCKAGGATFFFKQWGEWTPGENVERQRGTVDVATWFNERWLFDRENLANTDGHIEDEPDLYRIGKKAAGRHLDGELHNAMPVRP